MRYAVEQNIVTQLNENERDYQFTLIRNELKVIKYGLGDYFKKHQYMLNVDSDEFKNYTFELGLKCCDMGCSTIFYINDNSETSDILIKSPGNMIIYKKDIIYEK